MVIGIEISLPASGRPLLSLLSGRANGEGVGGSLDTYCG